MKKALLALGILLLCRSAYCEIVIDKLEDPEYLNGPKTAYNTVSPFYNTGGITTKRTYNLNSGQLSKVERKVFGRTYVGDDATNRLKRLESNVFGAVQTGDENNRLKRLSSATQNLSNKYPEYTAYNNYNRYNNYYNYRNPYNNMYTPYRPYNGYYQRPGLRRLFKTIKNNNGALTGFTPPTTYQDPYFNNFSMPYPPANSYYTTTTGSNGNFTNLFSNGQSGSETYYDDGRYRKNLSSSSGGCSVQVIN